MDGDGDGGSGVGDGNIGDNDHNNSGDISEGRAGDSGDCGVGCGICIEYGREDGIW